MEFLINVSCIVLLIEAIDHGIYCVVVMVMSRILRQYETGGHERVYGWLSDLQWRKGDISLIAFISNFWIKSLIYKIYDCSQITLV